MTYWYVLKTICTYLYVKLYIVHCKEKNCKWVLTDRCPTIICSYLNYFKTGTSRRNIMSIFNLCVILMYWNSITKRQLRIIVIIIVTVYYSLFVCLLIQMFVKKMQTFKIRRTQLVYTPFSGTRLTLDADYPLKGKRDGVGSVRTSSWMDNNFDWFWKRRVRERGKKNV